MSVKLLHHLLKVEGTSESMLYMKYCLQALVIHVEHGITAFSVAPMETDLHLCPLSCRLSHRQSSTLQGLHIAVVTHNCSISSRSGVHPLDYMPCIPLTKTCHSHLYCTILLGYLTSKPLSLKHSFTLLIHLFRCLPTE